MKPRLLLVTGALLIAAFVFSQGKAPAQKTVAIKPTFTKHVAPYLKKYCMGCHTGKDAPDKVDFSLVKTEADAKKYSKWMTKGEHEVAEKKMPPKGSTMPKADENKMFSAWVKANLAKKK